MESLINDINWNHYSEIRTVEMWKAVALCCSINPDLAEHLPNGYVTFILSLRHENEGLAKSFKEKMKVATSYINYGINLVGPDTFIDGKLHSNAKVNLIEFISWARNFGWCLPDKLIKFLQKDINSAITERKNLMDTIHALCLHVDEVKARGYTGTPNSLATIISNETDLDPKTDKIGITTIASYVKIAKGETTPPITPIKEKEIQKAYSIILALMRITKLSDQSLQSNDLKIEQLAKNVGLNKEIFKSHLEACLQHFQR